MTRPFYTTISPLPGSRKECRIRRWIMRSVGNWPFLFFLVGDIVARNFCFNSSLNFSLSHCLEVLAWSCISGVSMTGWIIFFKLTESFFPVLVLVEQVLWDSSLAGSFPMLQLGMKTLLYNLRKQLFHHLVYMYVIGAAMLQIIPHHKR